MLCHHTVFQNCHGLEVINFTKSPTIYSRQKVFHPNPYVLINGIQTQLTSNLLPLVDLTLIQPSCPQRQCTPSLYTSYRIQLIKIQVQLVYFERFLKSLDCLIIFLKSSYCLNYQWNNQFPNLIQSENMRDSTIPVAPLHIMSFDEQKSK